MFLFLIIGYLIFSAGMYFVFPKAGVDAWKGLVPGLNLYEMAGIVGRKKTHAWWMLFPIVNIFIFSALVIDLARSFGRHSFLHHFLAVVFAPFYSLWLGLDPKNKYNGPIPVSYTHLCWELMMLSIRLPKTIHQVQSMECLYWKYGRQSW